MDNNIWKSIPYFEWMAEADKVFQEELQALGFSPYPGSIMLRARAYVLRLNYNSNGGIESITVQEGWQQALRRKS